MSGGIKPAGERRVPDVRDGTIELQKYRSCPRETERDAACPLCLNHEDDYVKSVIHMSGCVTARTTQDVKHGRSHQHHVTSLINTLFSRAALMSDNKQTYGGQGTDQTSSR